MEEASMETLFQNAKVQLQDHGFEITITSCCFNIFPNNTHEAVKTRFLILPTNEEIMLSKASCNTQKVIHAVALFADFTYQQISFTQDELNIGKFKEIILMKISSFGFMPDEQYKYLYGIFAAIAQNGLQSQVIYSESGLTSDMAEFIYKGNHIKTAVKTKPSENEYFGSAAALGMMLKCCRGKSVILLMIQMIGLVYEMIKQLPNEKMRLCCITVLPYIYGDSGCGKTTISKALYDNSYDNRFLSLATSTEASILKKLSSVFSGVIIVDDVPHSAVNRCSKKDLDKLEMVLRTYGDVGAEKSTARGQLASTSAWAVVTAEALFVTIASSVLRILPIHLERGDVNFDAVESFTRNRAIADRFMVCYLRWFIGELKFDATRSAIMDIPNLTSLYMCAHKEILGYYTQISEARIIDSHTQILMYFDFFRDFFKLMKLSEEEICKMRLELKQTLYDAAKTQCLYLYESSLPFYINQVLQAILDNESIGHYHALGKTTDIQTSGENVRAYRCGDILLFNVAQKRWLFSQIKQNIPNGNSIKDKEIIQTLISMNIYLDAKTDRITDSYIKDNRININGKETRVLKILIDKENKNYEN